MGSRWRVGSRVGCWLGRSLLNGSPPLGALVLSTQWKPRLDWVRAGRYHADTNRGTGVLPGWPAGATEGVEEGLRRRIAEELGSFRHLSLSLLAAHCHTAIEKS